MLPYQLPCCVQFVYADMNQAELDRLQGRVVPGPEHVPAAALTAHYVTGLVPNVDSYPELAVRLRLRAENLVEGLAAAANKGRAEDQPAARGAGQFPTIGRAALFGTFLDGIAPAMRDIRTADRQAGQLRRRPVRHGRQAAAGRGRVRRVLGGRRDRGRDLLRLPAPDRARRPAEQQPAGKLYPLVLMPSAFEEGLGGGRRAELNAGRALLDLFRLVDQQNGAEAQRELRAASDRRPDRPG